MGKRLLLQGSYKLANSIFEGQDFPIAFGSFIRRINSKVKLKYRSDKYFPERSLTRCFTPVHSTYQCKLKNKTSST